MPEHVTEQQVVQALIVILSDREHYSTTLNWAVNYAQTGAAMCGEELRVQCLYILNNLSTWRHPQAKLVRDTLKRFSKQKAVA